MQESVALRTQRVAAFRLTLGASGLLRIFSGALPYNCASGDPAGLLCTIVLPTPAFGEANGIASMAGVWAATALGGSGYAKSFRMYDSNAVCHVQGLVSEPWQPSFYYTAGQQASNGNGVYSCVNAGMSLAAGTGPGGAGINIQDGGVLWNFAALAPELVLASTAVVPGQAVSVSGFAITAANA